MANTILGRIFTGSSSGGGSGTTINSVGTGTSLVVAPDNVKSLIAGTNITITDNGNDLTLNVTADDITVVANYSALPAVGTVTGKFYWCSASQGTYWLPGSLGGTYYSAGLYYSNGVTWEFLDVPYQATQATVNTGTNTDQFVTPATLNAATTVERPLTFSTGLTRSTNTITSNLSTGISGGQTAIGGTGAGENLTLSSTSNATKGNIYLGSSTGLNYDQVNTRLGIGMVPTNALDITKTQNSASSISLLNSNASTASQSRLVLSNGTNAANIGMTGTGYTAATYVPQDGLYVNSGGAGGISYATTNSSATHRWYGGATPSEYMRLDSAGKLGLGTTPSYQLHIVKTQNSNTSFLMQNASTGTAGTAQVYLQNSTNILTFGITSTGYTASAQIPQNGSFISGQGAGGMSICASDASGAIRFYSGGTTTRWTMGTSGHLLGAAGINIQTDTTTGMKIWDSTSQKGAFWNATPVVQPTTAIGTSTFTANTSGIIDDSATFGGYKISQVVKALQTIGLLA